MFRSSTVRWLVVGISFVGLALSVLFMCGAMLGAYVGWLIIALVFATLLHGGIVGSANCIEQATELRKRESNNDA